jgi:hypothetical protein
VQLISRKKIIGAIFILILYLNFFNI